jgi:hypothetical protein
MVMFPSVEMNVDAVGDMSVIQAAATVVTASWMTCSAVTEKPSAASGSMTLAQPEPSA